MNQMQQELFKDYLPNYGHKNLLPRDGEVEIYPSFFSPTECSRAFRYLQSDINWTQESMKLFGKKILVPRLTAWYGDPLRSYRYSGIDMHLMPWNEGLLCIKNRIENFASLNFTSVLLNYYRNGNDSVSWHRDNEKVLRKNPIIASVSFGATRKFKFRHTEDHKLIRSVDFTDGMLIVMKGETQHKWEHTIPKSPKVSEPRINLTFRILY